MKSFKEYQELAGVTRKLDETPLEMAHYALGLSGESGELCSPVRLSEEAWVKELGDCFWYAAGVCSVMGIDLEGLVNGIQQPKHFMSTVQHTLLISAAAVCELAKKYVFYGKVPADAELRSVLTEYMSCLMFLCQIGGYDPLVVCEKNIAKLEARFGGKFDAFRAINRNLEAEEAAVAGVAQ